MSRKVKSLIIIALLASLASCAQDVKFTGAADRKFDGDKIVLYNHATGDHDSAFVKDGRFVFTVPFKEPTLYMFYSELEMKTKGGYSPYGIMVTEPGTINIDADVENFSDSKVTGSKENDLYKSVAEKNSNAQQKMMDDLEQKYGKEFVMNRNPDTSSIRYKNLLQDYYKLSDSIQQDQVENLKQFINANPKSFTAVYLLNGYATTLDLPELQNLYASLPAKYKDTKSGKSISSVINARKITAIGNTAPDFTQPDTSGNSVKLSDFRGNYVLVDFWASWCGPCRAENPNLLNTYKKYKNKGFRVLGVSLDQPGKKASWLAAIHKDGLTWTQVSDLKFWENEVAVLYGIKAIPSNLLLDPQGKIIAKDLRGDDLNKKLSEIYGG